MSDSLFCKCANCGKPVIRINRSKRRTCSHACYMVLWRRDKRQAQILKEKALKEKALKE